MPYTETAEPKTRVCNICNHEKPIKHFTKSGHKSGRRRNFCSSCQQAKYKRSRYTPQGYQRDIMLVNYYLDRGIRSAERIARLAKMPVKRVRKIFLEPDEEERKIEMSETSTSRLIGKEYKNLRIKIAIVIYHLQFRQFPGWTFDSSAQSFNAESANEQLRFLTMTLHFLDLIVDLFGLGIVEMLSGRSDNIDRLKGFVEGPDNANFVDDFQTEDQLLNAGICYALLSTYRTEKYSGWPDSEDLLRMIWPFGDETLADLTDLKNWNVPRKDWVKKAILSLLAEYDRLDRIENQERNTELPMGT